MSHTQAYLDHLSRKNSLVLHNVHVFKRYYSRIWEFAYESNARVAMTEAKKLIIEEETGSITLSV